MTVKNKKQKIQHKVLEKDIKSLKNKNNLIDGIGDKFSYSVLKESIKHRNVLVPILIESNGNILWGKERVLICMELGIETIPAIEIGEGMSEEELYELEVELLLTTKNITFLDSIQLYRYQQLIFQKKGISYTEHTSNIIGCSQRTIQLKIEAGKVFSTLPEKVQKIFQRVDTHENLPLKLLTSLVDFDKQEFLNEFNDELLRIEQEGEVRLQDLKTLSKFFDSKVSLKKRNNNINEKMEEKKQDVENKVNENSTIKELNGLTESLESEESSHVITNLKKVFQYQIKRHFNLDVDVTEERDVMVIQSELKVDFKEEIKLIKSIIKGDI